MRRTHSRSARVATTQKREKSRSTDGFRPMDKPCRHCGAQTAKPMYCSRYCNLEAWRARRRNRICQSCSSSFDGYSRTRFCAACLKTRLSKLNAIKAVAREQARRERACVVCGQLFTEKRTNGHVQPSCGNPLCRGELIRRALLGRPRNFIKVDRSCVQCGRSFSTMRARFCKRCIRRNLKKRYGKCGYVRAKLRGLPRDHTVTQVRVFERDRWICQLCGQRTPKRLRGTNDDRAPSVDHIVPLSLASSPGHVWHNVQCACRSCNQRKSARTIGQLRLSI